MLNKSVNDVDENLSIENINKEKIKYNMHKYIYILSLESSQGHTV